MAVITLQAEFHRESSELKLWSRKRAEGGRVEGAGVEYEAVAHILRMAA